MHGRLLAAESRLVTLAATHHQHRWPASLHPNGELAGTAWKGVVGELPWQISVVCACVGIAAACSWICSPKAGLLVMLSLAARFPAAKPKRPKLHFTASQRRVEARRVW